MDSLATTIQALGDLELAVLLSLIAEQHCIITTNDGFVQPLAEELMAIASGVFNLSSIIVNCSPLTTLDDFREGVLVDVPDQHEDQVDALTPHLSLPSFQHLSPGQSVFRNGSGMSNSLDERRVANIVIAKNLNLASHNVQTQALELIRTRRLYSHTAMHAASEDFLFIALQSSTSGRLTHHLNDLFAISHHHFPEDGFPNFEDGLTVPIPTIETASLGSMAKPSSIMSRISNGISVISHDDLYQLRVAAAKVRVTAEVAAYLHNTALFMRLSRYIAGGVSALATSHFRSIVKALAPLHNLNFCPPSLVALAARKVYPHRLVLATPKTERSLQWGSDPRAVQEALRDMTVEDAIEDVLLSVEAPL